MFSREGGLSLELKQRPGSELSGGKGSLAGPGRGECGATCADLTPPFQDPAAGSLRGPLPEDSQHPLHRNGASKSRFWEEVAHRLRAKPRFLPPAKWGSCVETFELEES